MIALPDEIQAAENFSACNYLLTHPRWQHPRLQQFVGNELRRLIGDAFPLIAARAWPPEEPKDG